MTRVLILSSLYYPNVGGVENSIKELTKEFLRLEYEVNIVCSDRNNVNGDCLPFIDSAHEAKIFRYRYPRNRLGFFYQFFSCIKVIKENKLFACDVIIARSAIPIISAMFAGVRNIKYLVPSVYVFQDRPFVKSSFKRIVSFAFNSFFQISAFLVSKNYVFSESMRSQVKRASLGLKNAQMVSPGVDSNRFCFPGSVERREMRRKLGVFEDQIVILGLGRFSELKQFDHVIKSMKCLGEEFLLYLVGDGPEKKKYEELVKYLGLEERVRIFDATKYPEYFYQISDVFVMVSRYESFGQVLLEATSSGLPIVAYPNSESINTSVEFIYGDYPTLIFYSKSQDSTHLAVAIRDAAASFEREHSKKDLDVFLDKYSWRKLALEFGSFVDSGRVNGGR
jgi:glycosyltransferase involved in cell wall biosynthesis